MQAIDYFALTLFILAWTLYSHITNGTIRLFRRDSLTRIMTEYRRRWILNSLGRDLKMIDTQILAGLQNGTAFFASTSIFALGGCFALLGATEKVDAIFRDLPIAFHGGRTAFELKVGGLTGLFGYSFFKFGWSYRLFNYCTILFGGLPMLEETRKNPVAARAAAERVIQMNAIAASHFNAGLRAIFLSIGYLGWFVNAYLFLITTAFVLVILIRRQFFSPARRVLMEDMPTAGDTPSPAIH